MTSTSAFLKYQSRMQDAVQLSLEEENTEIEGREGKCVQNNFIT